MAWFDFIYVMLVFTSGLVVTSAMEYQKCGDTWYSPMNYTCFPPSLCPVINSVPSLLCGDACYLPSAYSCDPPNTLTGLNCGDDTVSTFHISDPPYENFFYSDCKLAAHVVVSTPREDSNLTIISPRLVVAFPAGNSGVLAYFAPKNGVNGSLHVGVVGGIEGVYEDAVAGGNVYPMVGVKGRIGFNNSAYLKVGVLGGVRAVRDFTEGPSILNPVFQDGVKVVKTKKGYGLTRRWLDNITDMSLEFSGDGITIEDNKDSALNTTLVFKMGTYTFTARYNYPQLRQIPPSDLFSTPPTGSSAGNDTAKEEKIKSLSFLSYSQKLLAGTWRFLTYFGRDSVFSMLLLDPILSTEAWEAGLSALLERTRVTTGEICHEEAIGDYAIYLNQQQNLTENITQPFYDYKMADTDFLLQIALGKYFVDNPRGNPDVFFKKEASVNPNNTGSTYMDLAILNANRVIELAKPFTGKGNQTKENLVRLKQDQIVGNWRDSTYGIGGGIFPYDVNTALVPAALRAISKLAGAGVYPNSDWEKETADMAKIWEDSTLSFFSVNLTQSEAVDRLNAYMTASNFSGLDNSNSIDASGVRFHAVGLDGYNNLSQVQVMNSDDCFRHFLLNTTDDGQLTDFINQTANNILRTFPAGLMTDVGVLVANPAFGSSDADTADIYAANFSTNAYHGTVVWSFNSLSMMARGLQIQLRRCDENDAPGFCKQSGGVYDNVKKAYNALWDVIEKNEQYLASEVWSWEYKDDKFVFVPLGDLPPPPGTSPTEADVRQLWSLTFLAVGRDEGLR